MLVTNTFEWQFNENIDGEFTFSLVNNSTTHQCTEFLDTSLVPGTNPRIYNPEYKCMLLGPKNYIGISGKILNTNKWDINQDDYITHLENTFLNSPLSFIEYTTQKYFDWNTRMFSRVIDFSLRPKNIWIKENSNLWTFDGPDRIEPFENGAKFCCTIDKDIRTWDYNICQLTQGSSISYSRANTAYLFVLNGSANINGNELPENTILNMTSNTININATTDVLICIKEKNV